MFTVTIAYPHRTVTEVFNDWLDAVRFANEMEAVSMQSATATIRKES